MRDVRRDVMRDVRRDVMRDVRRDAMRDVRWDAMGDVRRDVMRDAPCGRTRREGQEEKVTSLQRDVRGRDGDMTRT